MFTSIMSWRLTIASFTCFPLVYISSVYFGEKLYHLQKDATDLNAASAKASQETISNIRTVI